METKNNIKIKSPEEIEILRQGGKILSSIIKETARSLKSGMTTKEVNDIAEDLMKKNRVKAAFKGYRGFPESACISVNQEIVHGIPNEKVIDEGDIVSLDMGIIHKDYYTDMAVTVGVGKISSDLKKLIDVTRQSLLKGIAKAKVNNHLSDISFAVQNFVESRSFAVVRDFVGHGIGKSLHEEPEIPNFGSPHCGPVLKEGMVFCIEPMVNMGTWQAKIGEDGWTVETLDGKASAHFEHTVAVTGKGPEILTQT